jgi:hypothetical protein
MSEKKVHFQTREGRDVSFNAAPKVKKKIDKMVDKSKPDQTNLAVRDDPNELTNPVPPGDMMAEQFPEQLDQHEKMDERMMTKLSYQSTDGVTPFGVLQASEADFDWLNRKRQKGELANLHKWFAERYDKASPEQKKMAHELYPEFYAARDKVLAANLKMAKRIARIKLHGPQNKRDLLLEYAVASGYINADPLEDILHPERSAKRAGKLSAEKTFVRGLLNPRARNRGTAAERAHNAKTLTGFDMSKYPGRPHQSGTVNQDGSPNGYHFSYRDFLNNTRTNAGLQPLADTGEIEKI